MYKDKDGRVYPMFKIVFREEIPRTEFTMDSAMKRIIELNDEFNFDHISIDRGYGDVQIELLKKYGKEHPHTGLHTKIIGYQLGQKINVRDPHTMKIDKKDIKPFMVNNSVRIFERNKIVLNPKDKVMIRQLENYRVKSISSTGRPTYIDEDEHSIDAMNLALVCFEQNYGDLLKVIVSGKVGTIPQLDIYRDVVHTREILSETQKAQLNSQATSTIVSTVSFGRKTGYVVESTKPSRRRQQPFTRSFTK